MKMLPVGVSSFEKIINNNCTYVDKTSILYELIQSPSFYFLSRPRRFGKSLTCSTLEAIFQGKRELFNGLAMSHTNYDWKRYPIVRLDFSDIDHRTLDVLQASLSRRLAYIGQEYAINLDTAVSVNDLFFYLIAALYAKHGPVVLIIDEYDKPIIDHIGNPELAIEMRSFMKSFYGILKGARIEENLRFLFMTGVSKFSKVSVFSELNNLDDLTLDRRSATLCGYTKDDLEHVFLPHVDRLAQELELPQQEALDKLQFWYNGYRFSDTGEKVYNPFSILNCLNKRKFANYWFVSGTPSFMMHFVYKNPSAVQQIIALEAERLTISQMDTLSLETYFQDMVLLFLQAGYLTIASFDDQSQVYQLAYPNYEIRLSMTEQILHRIAHISSVQLAGFVVRFRNALMADDINSFCGAMKDFFELLPLTVIMHREKFYQGVFFTVAKLVGARIDAEQATSRGYIDAVLEGNKNTYVIELKKDKTPDIALKQIEDKQYYAKFIVDGTKPVVLVGMNFDYSPDTGVTLDWKIKKPAICETKVVQSEV